MSKKLPADITSYDLLKTFAVITMVIDHIGVYFFPDELWWRAVGRSCVPVWFFLIGYARTRDLSPLLIGGGLILLAGNFIAGMSVLPLNVLFTIMLIRLCIDSLMGLCLRRPVLIWSVSAILFVLALPSYFLTEYGSQAIIMAMFGYLVRRRDLPGFETLSLRYMIFALLSFTLLQRLAFAFNPAQFLSMFGFLFAVMLLLISFRPRSFPRLTLVLTAPVGAFIRLCGRHTLEIYVLHLLLFKALAVYWGLENYSLFQWHWFPV